MIVVVVNVIVVVIIVNGTPDNELGIVPEDIDDVTMLNVLLVKLNVELKLPV